MNYYNKYLKYKKKYLELKYDNSQYGGSIVPCNKGYANVLGTCWAVSIQMIICFGHFTSGQLKCVMESFNNSLVEEIIKNAEKFIDMQILKIKVNTELTNVFAPYDIFSENKIGFVKKILHKFIERYYNKVMNRQFAEKPENINPIENQERCERIIAENFKNLFNSHKNPSESFGGGIYDQYLFCNLLSIFFLDYKISFTNYYDKFNSIKFNHETDLGILISIPTHVCSLFICNGTEKFYNDNNKKMYDCEWIKLLNKSTSFDNLYIEEYGCLNLIFGKPIVRYKDKLFKVYYLTVISKYEKDTPLDIDIKRFLQYKDVKKIEDMELQTKLADRYLNNSQFENSKEMYELAVKQNYSDAQYKLGYMYYYGNGIDKDYPKAKEMFELAANQDNSDAQCQLGNMYYYGDGIDKSYLHAKRMYELAMKQGNSDAPYELGNMYYNGEGVTQDYTTAKTMYELAAKQGYRVAQYMLGNMYYYGEGGKQDYLQAKENYTLAAKQEYPAAQYALGNMYYYGEGLDKKDYATAKTMYELAANQGYRVAQYMLGNMYYYGEGGKQDYLQAKENYTLAAKQEYPAAQYALGNMYYYGEGLDKKDYATALVMFKLAAKNGHDKANKMLNIIQKNGHVKANKMLNKSQKNGHAKAKKNGHAKAKKMVMPKPKKC